MWSPVREQLYDESGAPRWLEHPVHEPDIDVVALPLTDMEHRNFYCYDLWPKGQQLAVGVASRLFIIGFPFVANWLGAWGTP